MLLLTTFLAKPIFKVNKPLFISKQTMDAMWQNIPRLVKDILPCHKILCDMEKYSTLSFNDIHVQKKLLKIFHNVACNMF
jgi:hypothetical protein